MRVHFTKNFQMKANKLLSPERINDLVKYLTDNPRCGEKLIGLPSMYTLEWDRFSVSYQYLSGLEEVHLLGIDGEDDETFGSEEERREALKRIRVFFRHALRVLGLAKLREMLKEHWDDIEDILDWLS